MNTDSITDSISEEDAILLDIEWADAGMPANGLRIYGLRKSGNRVTTYLAIPGNDSAPCYEYFFHRQDTGEYAPAYYHVSGPTLAEWEEWLEQERLEQEQAEAAREAAELYEWASGR